jgi:hypothetical protein
MAQESLICDSIVERVALDWRGQDLHLSRPTYLQVVTAVLAQFARLPPGTVFIVYGRAHQLILPHPANPQRGTRWTPNMAGGGKLDLVLSRVDQPAQWVHLAYHAYAEQGEIGIDGPTSWLVADVNPTTTLTGNNLLPATIADPQTGEIDELPSSSPRFLRAAYRLGLSLLPDLAQQAGLIRGQLFSRQTLQAIQDGDVRVVRTQWAAYLPCDVRQFLQLLVVLYDQTISHKNGIIQLAKHLRFTFNHYPDTGPLTGVMLRRCQGNKLQYSISFYDKAAEVDVTIHSAGVLTLVGAARRRLPQLLKRRPQYLDAASAQRFLHAEPRPTVWWLERSVGILSHTTTPDCSRRSFGSWLIPHMVREVLRLDCIAGFTVANLQALSQEADPVVAAWRKTERAEDDWAGALARASGCSEGWVYERRKWLLARHKIDIKMPFAYYRDLIFFGPNSLTRPKVRAALNAALASGDAATNLRLRQQAAQDFDRQRIGVVGATVRRPPLLMSPKVAIKSTAATPDQPGVGRPVPSVEPPAPDPGALQVRGSLSAKGSSPGA